MNRSSDPAVPKCMRDGGSIGSFRDTQEQATSDYGKL
jgi:hypothetical protein